MSREVLFIGSIPLAPASEVFKSVGHHVGPLAPRIPDGEQIGWLAAAFRNFAANPDLEVSRRVPLTAGGANPINIYRPQRGVRPESIRLGPYGYAENAAASYGQFKACKARGEIAPGTKYQVTLPGPGTSAYAVEIEAKTLLPIATEALMREVDEIFRLVPAEEAAVQIDVAMKAEHEEYRRRPEAWDQPMHSVFDWSTDQMADAVATLANHVPAQAELGFHICSIWHNDPHAGQDNRVLVDSVNAILARLTRPCAYVHIPVIPDHVQADYDVLKAVDLPAGAKLYVGLINLVDRLEGSRKRVAMARAAGLGDFGVAMFCGIGRPSSPAAISYKTLDNPALAVATVDTIGEVLDLHRATAEI